MAYLYRHATFSGHQYVKVFFNGEHLGSIYTAQMDPNGGSDAFELRVPMGIALQDCKLTIELFDATPSSEDTSVLVGSTTITAAALKDLMHRSAPSSMVDLHAEVKSSARPRGVGSSKGGDPSPQMILIGQVSLQLSRSAESDTAADDHSIARF